MSPQSCTGGAKSNVDQLGPDQSAGVGPTLAGQHPSTSRTGHSGLTTETAGLLVRTPVRLRLVEILDVLTNMAKTGRLGPVFSGAEWSDVTAALGEPWDIATMSRNREWPRLFAYGDLELSVCRCRKVPQGHRERTASHSSGCHLSNTQPG